MPARVIIVYYHTVKNVVIFLTCYKFHSQIQTKVKICEKKFRYFPLDGAELLLGYLNFGKMSKNSQIYTVTTNLNFYMPARSSIRLSFSIDVLNEISSYF